MPTYTQSGYLDNGQCDKTTIKNASGTLETLVVFITDREAQKERLEEGNRGKLVFRRLFVVICNLCIFNRLFPPITRVCTAKKIGLRGMLNRLPTASPFRLVDTQLQELRSI